ncbi:MAG: fibronectin type III domain-containing protein [Verrucomicrobia bacterium]|nr:fibronectin type III domain-containing protein [Verrucomicrobiota bacterium]
MKAALVLLLPVAAIGAQPVLHDHVETATSARHEFVIRMGGTMDGENTRTPIGYGAWSREFEAMREVRIENVGDAPVVNPWVFVNGRRDWRTVEKIIAGATRGCASDRERAIAIWRFVIGHRFHATPNDGDNVDPVRQFNVYGYSLCGDIGQTIRQLWKVAGFKTRCGRPHGHCLTEVWFDNAWRSLDGDEQIICLSRDNETIGNETDVVRDHDLMKRTHTYGILANDDPLTDQFSASLHVYEGKREGDYRDNFGHRMDLTLRPGESLAWRWDNVGRYHGTNLKTGWGPQAAEPLANGRLVYAPPNVAAAGEKAGEALIIPMASPYVIVGGKLDARGEAKASISFDQKKWEPLATSPVGRDSVEPRSQDEPRSSGGSAEPRPTVHADLDPLFPPEGKPRYRYWLKFEPAGALQSLRVENVLQMAPLSLPALNVGENRIVYSDENGGDRKVRVSFEWAERDDSPPPAAPAAEFPKDGGEVEGTQFTFKWKVAASRSDAATDYHFQLSNRADMKWPLSPTFDRLVSKTPQRGTASWAIPWRGLLNPGQRYYWRVRARNKDGLWGAWSRTFSFTPQGPGVPLDVRYDAATGAIRWQANPHGRPPMKWRIHASDEKGFTASDTPHKVLWESGYESKRDVRELPPTVVGETDKPEWRSLTNAFYRVVAVDAQGVASGPSDYAAMPRPKFISQPPTRAKAGETYTYQPRAIRSLGDLRCKNYAKDKIYWAGFWNIEKPVWSLVAGPDWLKLDAGTGELSGAPPAEAAGQEVKVELKCEIAGVGVDTQAFTIRVAK